MRTFLRVVGMAGLALAVAGLVWWMETAPPAHLRIAEPYSMGAIPEAIVAVTDTRDPIGETVETFANGIPGYDDIVLQEALGRAWVTGRDGWIWRVDLETGEAQRFVDAPLMAAGARMLPGDDNTLCFCASHLHGETYPSDEAVGLYGLTLDTREVFPIVLRVPNPPKVREADEGREGTVYPPDSRLRLDVRAMDVYNSRAIAFCNDFDISDDGQRFYFSEPFAYEGASMGGGAMGEAITLGKNGRLWLFERSNHTSALIAQGYNFVDGVLLEAGDDGREQSVLVTETTKFRVLRYYLEGERAGEDEVVWEYLPSMPDGLTRGPDGTIWIGMIKQRTPVITWAHANPWVKPLMLRLPLEALPVPTVTGVLALSPDASTPLWYAEHEGVRIHDIAAAIPGRDQVYLANFSDAMPGVHRIPYPIERP